MKEKSKTIPTQHTYIVIFCILQNAVSYVPSCLNDFNSYCNPLSLVLIFTALIVGYAVRECFVNGSWAPKADYSVCMEQIKGVIEEDKKKEDKLVSLLER